MSPMVPAEILVAAMKANPVAFPLPSEGFYLLDCTSTTNFATVLAEKSIVNQVLAEFTKQAMRKTPAIQVKVPSSLK